MVLKNLLMLMMLSCATQAQTLHGIIKNAQTNRPLSSVSVTDLATGKDTSADEQGNYALPCHPGDMITFMLEGYKPYRIKASSATVANIPMQPLSVELQEYILRPDSTAFQRDSAYMASTYGKEMNTEPIKPKVNGLGVDNLIGSAAQKMSRKYKRNKEFKENFQKDEQQKYIDTRYQPELVAALTGFSGDTLATFINTYPMDYLFARTATSLELKAWIRDNYKNYIKKISEVAVSGKP
jgi:hypothetical protein